MAAPETQAQALQRLLERTVWKRADMEEVARLSTARIIGFAPRSRFEPGALALLAGLKRLHFLSFSNSSLSGDDLSDLARLKYLWRLDLGSCSFAEADLERFAEPGALPKLTDLWLENTALTDAALPLIARLSGLEWLIVGGTRITDAGLEPLRALPRLRVLWVNNTEVSDAGLLQLDALRRLSALNIRNSKATPAGLEALFAAQVRQSKAPAAEVDEEARGEAEAALLAFMEAMNDWESEAVRRGRDIEQRHRAERPQPHVMAEAEAAEVEALWAELQLQKAAILERCCTRRKRAYAAGIAYGEPPAYDPAKARIVDAEQLAPSKVALFTEAGPLQRHRFVLHKKGGRWLVDSKQRWSNGWARDIL